MGDKFLTHFLRGSYRNFPNSKKLFYHLCFAYFFKSFFYGFKSRIHTLPNPTSIHDLTQFCNLILCKIPHIPACIRPTNPYCKVLQHLPSALTMHDFRVKLQGINLAFRIRNRTIMRISRPCKFSKSLRNRFHLIRVAHPYDRILLHIFKE